MTQREKGGSDLSSFHRNYPSLFKFVPVQLLEMEPRFLLTTAKDRPSSHLLLSKEACSHGRQYQVSAVSEFSIMFLCTGFWNSSKGPFISGEIPLGRLDLGWFLERDQALSLWRGSTDSKTSDNQRTNPSVQFSSVPQLCLTFCDPMNRKMPGFPVHHKLPEFTQTHAHQIGDAIQPLHPLSSPSPPALNPSQHQGLLQ